MAHEHEDLAMMAQIEVAPGVAPGESAIPMGQIEVVDPAGSG